MQLFAKIRIVFIVSIILYSLIGNTQIYTVNIDGKYYFDLPKCSIGIICVKKDSLWDYGTGFVVIDSNTVITAYHVIKNADSILYKSCENLIPLHVAKVYQDKDIALLRLNRPISQPLLLGSYGALNLGDTIITIGHDNGLSVNSGTIIKIYKEKEDQQLIRYSGFGHKGYSGGPVFNSRGQIIGVTLRGNEIGADNGQSEGVAIYIDFIYD